MKMRDFYMMGICSNSISPFCCILINRKFMIGEQIHVGVAHLPNKRYQPIFDLALIFCVACKLPFQYRFFVSYANDNDKRIHRKDEKRTEHQKADSEIEASWALPLLQDGEAVFIR